MKLTSRYITPVACVFILFMTGLLLTGMLFNLSAITTSLPGLAAMKFNTAVCLVLSSIALLLLNQKETSRRGKMIAFLFSIIVMLIASVSLSQQIFSWNTGIDTLFYSYPNFAEDSSVNPGRMPVATAVLLILFNVALLLIQNKKFHFFIHIILITGMAFLILLFLISITITGFDKPSSAINSTFLQSRFIFLTLYFAAFFSYPLSYLKFSFQKKITGSFVMISLALAMIFFAIHRNNQQTVKTARLVDHTHEVLIQAEKIQAEKAEMQNAVRGYLITGNEIYLPLFHNSAGEIGHTISRLQLLTKDNALQEARMDTLKKLIAGFITSRNQLIAERGAARFDDEKIKLELKDGKETIDKVRTLILTIQQEENILLAKRKAENEKSISDASRVITVFQLVIVLILLATFILIYNNIKQRNKAEEQLKEFKFFFNNNSDLCGIANTEGYFEIINTSFRKTLGYSEKEFCETPFIELVHPDDISPTLYEYQKLKSGVLVINFINRYRKKGGDYLWLEWNASPNPETGKLYCIARDITERKLLEEKLQQFNHELEKQVEEKTKEVIEKEKQYRFLLENMREGIQVIGYDWRYLFVNNSVVKQSKYSNEDLMGHTMMEKYPGIENTELFRVMKECMKERCAKVFENEFTFPDGSKEWFELSIQPVPEGLFILSMDITHRKNAEEKLKKYAEELQASNTELERFAYVASHDLQEPLRMVSSFLNLLEEELDGKLNKTTKEYIDFAIDGAARMKTLVNDLLLYSRVGTNKEDFTSVNLNEVMEYVTRVLQEDIEKNRAVINISKLPVIKANKTLISQLFTNLLSNALKYRGEQNPVIDIGYMDEPGQWIFFVKDNGMGIDPRFFDKIFIIFQRLHNKNEYSGTGIGLAICKKIVETHKGKIRVESEQDRGSTFYFSIPKLSI